jgi:hypothetical protein
MNTLLFYSPTLSSSWALWASAHGGLQLKSFSEKFNKDNNYVIMMLDVTMKNGHVK